MTDVVVVESPAKAKTINRYLGDNFTVLASFGHVRDLSPKDGSVRPDDNFAMNWQTDKKSEKHISTITKALKGAKILYLATDPDREGEAISWHIQSILEEKGLLKGISVRRVTFNEITRSTIQYAFSHPRPLDQALIEAYLARRALDYLVGFTLSPMLWRKLPGSRSAGRVQSVALRLICEREAEIETFRAREYWTVTAACMTPSVQPFKARMTYLDGKKLSQFDLSNKEAAHKAAKIIQSRNFSVFSIDRKKAYRHPVPPFTTSTLQQEASRKLGMSVMTTMRTAQSLYEGIDLRGETVGLITYMRTDGTQIATEAVNAIRNHIEETFGKQYLPDRARHYSSKAKNAQEAHEAIRPTNISHAPDQIIGFLTKDQHRLYELIWKRATASQMRSAELDQVAVDLQDSQKQTQLRANGSVITFDGFLRLYNESEDEQPNDNKSHSSRDTIGLLPTMQQNDPITIDTVHPEQHFTKPPPHFSEASLVKRMEEIGIGRPSTYATILQVLRTRDYVRMESNRFVPEDRGRLVTAFLTSFFERYVDFDFTAQLEDQLDDISGQRADWREVMTTFWTDFSYAVEQTKELRITDVINALDKDLGSHFFPTEKDGKESRLCHSCGTGHLGLKLGRFGAFIGCSNYPKCQYTRPLMPLLNENNSTEEPSINNNRVLGTDPHTGETISLRHGPWGFYLQKGEANPDAPKNKPPRAPVPTTILPEHITLDQAIKLLALPRIVGIHPETGEPVEAGLGRFGPYIRVAGVYGQLGKNDDVLTINLERAVEILAKKLANRRILGLHPLDQEPVILRRGRFGYFIQHGKLITNLPKKTDPDSMTLADAILLIDEKNKTTKLGKNTKQKAVAKTAARQRKLTLHTNRSGSRSNPKKITPSET